MTGQDPVSGGWTPPPDQLPPPAFGTPPPPGQLPPPAPGTPPPGHNATKNRRVVLIAVGAAAGVLLLLCSVGVFVWSSGLIFAKDARSQVGPAQQASSTSPPSIQGDYRPVENLCEAFNIDRYEDLVGDPPDEDPQQSEVSEYPLENGEFAQSCVMQSVVDGFDAYKVSVMAVVKLDNSGAEELYNELFSKRSVEADSAKNYHDDWDHYSMVETENDTYALAQHDNLFVEVKLYCTNVDKPKDRLKLMSRFAVDLTNSMSRESGS